jgi:hypothetical protein
MKSITFNKKRKSVQLQRLLMMMVAIMMAFTTLTACENLEENGTDTDENNSSYAEKAAVKYLEVHMSPTYDGLPVHQYVIYDNYGKRYREDWWGPIRDYGGDYISHYDQWETNIENHINKTLWKSIYKGEWENLQYKTEKKLETTWLSPHNIFSNGFKKQPNPITFAGKSCDIYTLTISTGTGTGDVTYTYALWNKIVMMHEVKASASGEIIARVEAVAITLNVPETAFTKTLDITWLPQ